MTTRPRAGVDDLDRVAPGARGGAPEALERDLEMHDGGSDVPARHRGRVPDDPLVGVRGRVRGALVHAPEDGAAEAEQARHSTRRATSPTAVAIRANEAGADELARQDATIVRSTVELAHNFGLRVVAEGVETEASWHTLADMGAHYAQGYLLTRPLAARELEAWLDDWAASQPLTAARRAVSGAAE
jgi:hypothetical protein